MNERIVRGRVDSAGRLVSADAPLLRLQQRAGAAIGQPLALPNLARLVALAQRLQRDISRPLYAADDHSDIHALVRVLPDGEGANLEISDWRTRPILLPEAPAAGAGMASADGWTWECDQRLRLLTLHAEGDAPTAA